MTARKREFDSSSREEELAIARFVCAEVKGSEGSCVLLVVKMIVNEASRDPTTKPPGRLMG